VRRARKRGHVSQDRWLVSYADFITLLFAFFVVMYAVSKSQEVKAAQVSEAIDRAFHTLGASGHLANTATRTQQNAADGSQSLTVTEARVMAAADVHVDLERMRQQLENALSRQIAAHTVSLQLGPDGLVISLREAGFFDSGSAIPHSEAVTTLKEVAVELKSTDYDLRVEGHTDNIPIHNIAFESNWELSSGRATRIARMLLELHAVPPERLSAAGYGEYHPLASNATPAGRATNRRVDLVVFPRVALTMPVQPRNGPKGWRAIGDDDPPPARR
jgi:chemotaxis protein MotB